MSNIRYNRFARLLARCGDLGTAEDADPCVALVYKDLLEAPAQSFLASHKVIMDAKTAAGTENKGASVALDDFDVHFRTARAVALAYVPALVVPETLKRQPTDTDKKEAIKDLLKAVNDRAGTPWAKKLLEGKFGTLAASVIGGLGGADQASTDLASARAARAQAYGPAYQQYLAFKNVVREVYGSHSRQYRRIHLRTAASADVEAEEPPASPAPAEKPASDQGVADNI
jgi:hypothetical protein